LATDVAGAIPGLFSFGTDATGCAVADGMLVGACADATGTEAATGAGAVETAVDAAGAVETATGAAGATIEAAVEAAVEAAFCTAATDDAIADCTAATDDAIADSMAGAADGAVTDAVDAIPGRFSFGAAAAEAAGTEAAGTAAGTVAAGTAAGTGTEAAAGTVAAAAAFDFTIPGFATPGFFFGRLARISSRSFISACPNSF
jgi:hypothetical protein